MQAKTILYAAGAFGAAALLVAASRKGGGIFGGDAERLSGVRQLYGASAGQQQGVNAAVQAQWAELEKTVFATQPDFWV